MPQSSADDEAKVGLLERGSPAASFEEEVSASRRIGYKERLLGRPRVLVALAVAFVLAFLFAVGSLLPRKLDPGAQFRQSFHSPPTVSLNRSQTLVTKPAGEHTVTVILLHGLGDSSHNLPFRYVLPESHYPYIKWVSPQANRINSTVNGNASTPAWYNIQTFSDLHLNEDEEHMLDTQRQINELIREERQILIDAGKEPRIAIGGFSQGAVMSLLNVVSSVHKLEAAFVLSGYLALPGRVWQLGPSAIRDTPIWWGHGLADPYLTAEHAAIDVGILQKPPFSFTDITYREFANVSHYWDRKEMEEMVAYFVKHVPEHR